ncbi:MAG: alpha/beta hydrolase [Caulobacter sp.]|nr:alpha/beta hydrolase [Caulobacter sp.]
MIDRRGLLLGLAAGGLGLRAGEAVAHGPGARSFAYGPAPAQRLDVYPNPRLHRSPVLVFVHGGGWRSGSRDRIYALEAYARAHGFLLVSIDYRVLPQARDAGDCARDVAAAVGWVRANAAKHGGDPRRIVLVGHSAGAHLSALVATDAAYLAAVKMKPADLAGAVLLDGMPYDALPLIAIEKRWPHANPDWMIPGLGARPAALSPTLRVRTGGAYPPMLIVYAGRRADAARDANAFARRLREVGAPVEVVRAYGDTHGLLNKEFGVAGDREGERAARFIATGKL